MSAGLHFIDLHSHPIPGVDDGPRSFEEALEMLRVAHQDGVRRLTATPHMCSPSFPNTDPLAINDAFAGFVSRLAGEAEKAESRFLRELEILLGAEYFVGNQFFEALEKKRILPLNGSRYLLVELPPFFGQASCEAALARIVGAGYTPVVAHVERLLEPRRAPDLAARWVDQGALLQVNVQSLLGGFRSAQRRTCFALLERRMVHVVASDAHDASGRPPVMASGYQALERRLGAEEARLLVVDYPSLILENRAVPRAA